MRFYTRQESDGWLSDRNRELPEKGDASVFTVGYPSEAYRYHFVTHWIATSLTFRDPALLLITEWGIWPNSENWHLYYKLRESYGDHRFLHEAPGHYFHGYETEELATFLQLAMLNGWGGYVLTGADYVNLFFSHDEWIDFYSKTEANLADTRKFFQADPQEPK